MRQFIEISGSCAEKMEVTIKQVYEAGGKLIVLASLARKINDKDSIEQRSAIFRDQVVVETDAKELLPVTYVMVDVDPEEVDCSADCYAARYQLRGVNRCGQFEMNYIGKTYPLLPKAKLRYQQNLARTDSFRIGDRPQFFANDISEFHTETTVLDNVLNIYSTVQHGVYKVVLEVITAHKECAEMPRALFPEAVFTGDDFNRRYKPTIEETIYFMASCRGVIRQYQTCAVSLEVPSDDLTAVVELIGYLDAAWDAAFYKRRRFDLVQVSTSTVLSCYADPWFVCARVNETDKRKYRQMLNQPIELDFFLMKSLRYDFRESLRRMISQDLQSITNAPAYEVMRQVFVKYDDDLELRQLLHCPTQLLCDMTDVNLRLLHREDTPLKEKKLLIAQLENYLSREQNDFRRLQLRYLLNRFNRHLVKSCFCREIAAREEVAEVKLILDFISLAVFDLMDDGRLRIPLLTNPVYLQYFAGDPEAAASFFNKFTWVASMDFDKDSDYAAYLTLKKCSSDILKCYGFHIDERYWDDVNQKARSAVSYPAADYRLFGKSFQVNTIKSAPSLQSAQHLH